MKRTVRRKPSARRPPSGRRIGLFVLLGAAVALVLAFAGYAAAARWLLSGPRLRSWINTTPETTLLDWDEAVSRWPGTVRLKNLRIRGSDQNVEWIIRLAEARADYSVEALLSRTFKVSRVQGNGLSFRLRQKLDLKDPTNPPIGALPPIPGFSDPPVRKPGDEPAAAAGNPWTVQIGGIAIEQFDEIWIDAYRFEGSARLHGRFFLRPGLRSRIGPSDVDFLKGHLHVGRQPLVSELAGKIHAEFEEWDPRRVQGDAVWRKVIAQVDLHGPHLGLEFLNYYFRRSREPRFSGGPGVLSLSGSIDHGKASGRALLAARGAKSRQSGVDLTGDLRVSLRIPVWNLEGPAIEISGSSLQVSDVVAAGAEDTRGWWARLDLPQARVNEGLEGKMKLECRDARPLFAVLRVGLPGWTRGLLTLQGLTANADVVLTRTRTRVHELEARGDKFHILGEYESRGEDERAAFLIETRLLRVGVKSLGGHTSLRLFTPVSWYAREKNLFGQTPGGDTEFAARSR
jgi:hypothetical protein